MTSRADPPKNAISYQQYLRNRIAAALFPWLSGPAAPEREAGL